MYVLQNFTPHPGQVRVLASLKRWIVVLAGVRGGKTYSCAAAFLNRIFRDVAQGKGNSKVPATGGRHRRPRYHAWVCAPTYDLLKEPRRYILQLLPESLVEEFYEGRELWLKGGILIEFKSTDNAKTLVSAGLNALWIDEADRVDADAWRGQLRTRLSDKQGWCIFSSTPYAARNGFLWQDLISRKDEPGQREDIDYITWRFVDNPTNAIAEYRAAKASTPERYFKREYEACLDAFVGLVFELRDEQHVIDIVPETKVFKTIVAGVDWGWNDPGAIVVVGDTGKQLIVLEERRESHMQVIAPPGERSWITEAIALREKWDIRSFACDPSSPANINAFQRAGLSAIGAFNDIKLGLRRIDEQLMMRPAPSRLEPPSPGLVIHRDCKSTLTEMRNLAWDTDKNGTQLEDPEPGNDHCVDALRYAVMELRRYPDPGKKVQRTTTLQRR